ncbi:MAG: DUF892 family protein [Nitrososphaeraceae archaeon]
MAKKRTSKTRTRNNVSTSIKRKGKRLTAAQKLILHLNEALAIENAAVQRLQSRIKHTKIENVKQRLQVHLEETKGQQDRLKQLISDLGILSQSLSEERSMADWIKTNMPDMIAQLWPEIEASIATVEGE